MKTLLLTLIAISSSSAFAAQANQQLECKRPENYAGAIGATLDFSGFKEGSGFFSVKNAGISYQYSSARLLCEGNSLEEISCVGLWYGHRGDTATVNLAKDAEGNLIATFNTSKLYQNKTITVPCTVKEANAQ